MNTLPVYQALIDSEFDGITAISLVDEGAVEVDFQMFNKDEQFQQFAIQNEDEHLLLGCVMRCDFNIYRNQGGFEYFIRYNRETIEKMATKMLKDHSFAQIDLMHDGNMLPQGMVELRELFIKDTNKGISPNGFDNVNDGSLFAVYKVNNDELWELCKQGVFNSFSLEGYFKNIEVKANKQDQNISIMSKIKDLMKKMLQEFGSVTTVDGKDIIFEGEELVEGIEVAWKDGEAVENGEYEIDDKIVVIADSKVVEIKEKEEEPEEEEVAVEIEAEDEEVVVEEEPAAEPEKDYAAEIDALKAEIEQLKSEIAAIKEALAEPAADTVVEEFSKATEAGKTGVKNVDRAISILSSLKD